MIPRKIHYFWFGGGAKPALAQRCIDGWRRRLPSFEIIEWNERSYDVQKAPFAAEAFRRKQWAFLSDYARLDVLLGHGGVYLDVDVEVRRDFAPLLAQQAFLGFMFDCNLSTAVIGAEPDHPLLHELLASYDSTARLDSPNNDLFTKLFLKRYANFRLDNSLQKLSDITVYPKEYFEFPVLWGGAGYSVHHFMGSWWRANTRGERIKSLAKRSLGRPGYWAFRTLSHRKAVRMSPFLERHLLDKGQLRPR
jgi:hypothetical protein